MKLEERVKKADEFLMEGKAEEALKILRDCLDTNNDKTLDNPYLHLRKGQSHYILGEAEEALREFSIAYTLDGERIFEDEDPRFLDFLKEGSGEGGNEAEE
jgi:tetratricopeptide (TPR) repeat protein